MHGDYSSKECPWGKRASCQSDKDSLGMDPPPMAQQGGAAQQWASDHKTTIAGGTQQCGVPPAVSETTVRVTEKPSQFDFWKAGSMHQNLFFRGPTPNTNTVNPRQKQPGSSKSCFVPFNECSVVLFMLWSFLCGHPYLVEVLAAISLEFMSLSRTSRHVNLLF